MATKKYNLLLHRSFQYLGIMLIMAAIGGGYWYWKEARAGVTQQAASKSGLVGYWSFDEGTGTQAGDASGQGNTGTLTNGPTWTDGARGKAVNFDGTNDYVNAGNGSSLGFTGNATFSAWINPTSLADYKFYLGKYSPTDSGYDFGVMGNGRLVATFRNGTHVDGFSSVGLVQTGVWQHVVVTQDSSCHVRIYRNGVLDTTLTNQQCFTNPSANLIIGTRLAGDGNNLSGSIDEVRVYSRTLSATEITSLYSLGATKFQKTQSSQLTNGLVGYWPFNGPDISGTTAYDRAGSNNGTLTNGPTTTIGRSGQALNFDGSNDYVALPDIAGLDASGSFTLSAWFKPVAVPGAGSVVYIMSKQGGGFLDWNIQINNNGSNGKLRFNLYNGGNTNVLAAISETVPTVGRWYNVTAVFERTTSPSARIYVDGILENTVTTTSFTSYYTPTINIGSDANGASSFNGTIDETRGYDRALSAGEVWDLYQLGNPDKMNSADSQGDPLEKGLVGYWKLDDASGTNATDSSGNGNTGTLTNGPTWTTGQIGGATSFDGSNDYITMGDPSALEVSTDFSIISWVNITANGSWPGIVTKSSSWSNSLAKYALYLYSTSGTLSFAMNGTSLNSSISPAKNSWRQVGVISKGNVVSFIYDGVLYAGGSISVPTYSTEPFNIGNWADNAGAGGQFPGSIDEVRIYNRALSAEEIAKLYKTTAPDNPDTGLVGYWSFNGSDISGTTAYDRSGQGNNGTLTNGPSVYPGKVGQGLNFDGTDDYISVPAHSSINNLNAFTYSVWVRPTDLTTAYDSILMKTSDMGDERLLWISYEYIAGRVRAATTLADSWEFHTGNGIVPENEWTHIAMSYDDGGDRKVHLYMNGAEINYDGQTAAVGAMVSDASYNLQIGKRGVVTADIFTGSIDEVRVYNRALSTGEIQALYNAGR